MVAAAIVRAIDQETANTGSAHFSEGDFLLAGASEAGDVGLVVIKSARLPNGKFDSKISFSK